MANESKLIRRELERLGAQHTVVSTNVELRRDGLPYSGRRAPDDSGVAVYFILDGRQQCIPCDRWSKVEENARAVWKSIEALRGLDRWGAKSFVDAAFCGFTAIAGPTEEPKPKWWEVLGIMSIATTADAETAYRRLAKDAHPDTGGSVDGMARLNKAIQEARESGNG